MLLMIFISQTLIFDTCYYILGSFGATADSVFAADDSVFAAIIVVIANSVGVPTASPVAEVLLLFQVVNILHPLIFIYFKIIFLLNYKYHSI